MLNGDRGRYEMIYDEFQSESQSIRASLQRSVELADREPWSQASKCPLSQDRLNRSSRKRRRKALKLTQSGSGWGSVWVPTGEKQKKY